MNMHSKEGNKLFERFCELTGASVQVHSKDRRPNQSSSLADKEVVELKAGQHKATFFLEIKNEIREAHIAALSEKMQPFEKWLLVCKYIPSPLKKTLKDEGINYVESAGNCFISVGSFYFYISDQAVTEFRSTKTGKVWKPAGLRFLFAILQQPELLNAPYRDLAKAAGVALGNIGDFLEELQQEGIVKKGQRAGQPFLFLENKEQLMHQWAELYNVLLKPKMKKGSFRFIDDPTGKQWQKLRLQKALWGGEPAGALLTNFLIPEELTLYTDEPNTSVMKDLRLLPDPAGNVHLIGMFWNNTHQAGNKQTVPPLLVYADLITSLDSRNRETALRIKEQYLA